MEENWYKPEAGEPYRPLIAIPNQVVELATWFTNCAQLFFTGIDPPSTLVPAASMVPDVTCGNPDPTADPAARQTLTGPEATPTPGQAPKLPQPEATAPSTTDNEQTGSAAEGGPKESAPAPSSQRHPFKPTPAQNQQFSTHQNEHMSEEAREPSATQSSDDPKQTVTSTVGLSPSENSIVLPGDSQTSKQTISAAAGHVAAAGSSGVYVDGSKLDYDSWPMTISSVDESTGINIGSQTEPMSGPAPESVSNLVAEGPRTTVGGIAISVDTSNNAIFGGTMPAMSTISPSRPIPPMKNRVVNLNDSATLQRDFCCWHHPYGPCTAHHSIRCANIP
ncbi:hypothetical protein OEA41_004324 [Lepraria neglecta]|uniref:Uncharacterized protein n=1 Tax=Lepraria neglecta TaxID=209136 RepID=A0AAE0DI63_9LECA|nr:hypothetical protein OEA41_004324 [Lepraria neglecta]